MSPASHSGLIYYSETVKDLVRKEKTLSFLTRKKKTLQDVIWEQDRTANRTIPMLVPQRACSFCTQCTFTHTEGADGEPSGECHTWKRETVETSQNWGASRTPRNHPLTSHFIESPEKTCTKPQRSFVAAQFKCTFPDSQSLCHSQRMRDPYPWKAQEESTEDLFFPPRPIRGFSSKSHSQSLSLPFPNKNSFYF